MLLKTAKWITIFFIDKKLLSPHKQEWYEYVLQTKLLSIIAISSMILVGCFFTKFSYIAIFLIVFLGLRRKTGGYHASNSIKLSPKEA